MHDLMENLSISVTDGRNVESEARENEQNEKDGTRFLLLAEEMCPRAKCVLVCASALSLPIVTFDLTWRTFCQHAADDNDDRGDDVKRR